MGGMLHDSGPTGIGTRFENPGGSMLKGEYTILCFVAFLLIFFFENSLGGSMSYPPPLYPLTPLSASPDEPRRLRGNA
jgi:hypothetical protein